MAKNRVAPDRPTKQTRDNFSDRSQSKFKSKIKIGQSKQKLSFPNFQNKTQHAPEDRYLKPSLSGSDNFFITPNNNPLRKEVKKPEIKNIEIDKSNKKPFDKKTYRLQKYSKKYKLEQWEDKRKKAVLRGYYRSLKEDEQKFDVNQIYAEYKGESDSEGEDVDKKIQEENENNLNASISQNTRNTATVEDEIIAPKNSKGKKNKAFKKAHLEFQRIKEAKQKKREELLNKKAQQEEVLQEYKRKKAEKFKKLSRKTKRGQPIMKDRIELLLERIQSTMV